MHAMQLRTRLAAALVTAALSSAWLAAPAFAQAEAGPATTGKPRRLAPGVLTVIPVQAEEAETFTDARPIVEIVEGIPNLDWTPHYLSKSNTLLEMAKEAVFRRSIWHLEFAFKPLRMIEVDIPLPTGKFERKQIWYMVYRVKNNGYHMSPSEQLDEFGHKLHKTTPINHPVRFFPQFVLEDRDSGKQYLDRLIPAATLPIRNREDPNTRLLNSVQMGQVEVAVSDERIDRSVWGVVTWEDLDPRMDFYSIYIEGLTNAYRWADPPGAFKPGDPPGKGRVFTQKMLQLNFWRPGDEFFLHEEEIRFGSPDDVDHRWVYR
jgi:hypothetical protein